MKPGDVFVVLSDRVFLLGDRAGRPFRPELAAQILREKASDSASDILHALRASIEEVARNARENAEFSIIVIKRV